MARRPKASTPAEQLGWDARLLHFAPLALRTVVLITLLFAGAAPLSAQAPPKSAQLIGPTSVQQASASPQAQAGPRRADVLRGEYGPYRANNDLLFYHLDVRVNPEKKFLSGKTTIRFRMLKDDARIQLDLHEALKVDKILLLNPNSKVPGPTAASDATTLKYKREAGAVFVDFPDRLRARRVYEIDFYYSGNPLHTGRFGGITFGKDPQGRHWINTACEGEGASIWWPNKDQWRDEVETMQISVA